ncbi:MAG TPA: rhomboid family intramembrane serine protease [Thermoanaerobaculia bacterium]|nr:rhomboid family intramembrane serine protease [Thermoanaerobaculia bacterium]
MRLRSGPVTTVLLAVIAVVFAVELKNGVVHSDAVLYAMGALTHDALRPGHYWRLLAAMFLHANWLHVLANSWSLYQLGTAYENLFGSRRFLIIYFVTGLCASVASSLMLPPHGIAVGASGAVLGILGAFIPSILRSPWRRERWARSLIAQLVFWALLNIILGFEVKEIDNTAHITGLVTGFLLGFAPQQIAPRPPSEETLDVTPRT